MGVKLREKELQGGRISLYLDVYHKGRRSYEFLDLYLEGSKQQRNDTRRLAEAIRAKRELEVFNNAYDFDRKDDDVLLTDYMEQIKDDLSKSGNKNLVSVLKHMRAFDKNDIAFDDLNNGWLEGFKAYLQTKVKKSTARTYFLMLRSILNQAANRGLIRANPMYKHGVKNIEKDPARISYLTDSDVEILWNAECGHRDVKRAFLFSVYTGLRLSDIIALNWSDIQHIRDKTNGDDFLQLEIQQKKTGDFVHIPIAKDAEPLLDVPHRLGDQVFDVTEHTIGYWLPRWKKSAGLKKHIHFHMARHTFATRLLRRGVDIYTVKELMGHESVASTEKYLHVVSSDKKKAIDKLDGGRHV